MRSKQAFHAELLELNANERDYERNKGSEWFWFIVCLFFAGVGFFDGEHFWGGFFVFTAVIGALIIRAHYSHLNKCNIARRERMTREARLHDEAQERSR